MRLLIETMRTIKLTINIISNIISAIIKKSPLGKPKSNDVSANTIITVVWFEVKGWLFEQRRIKKVCAVNARGRRAEETD